MSLEGILKQLEETEVERNSYRLRLDTLRERGRDTSLIERGIAETLRTLEADVRSFVVYGEPQSGKTEFMIALVCKLLDQGYKTIFVIMNDNTELEVQNFDRFHKASEMNPTPLRASQVLDMSDESLSINKARVIFCRKNARLLEKMIHACRRMEDRIVIDDEADYATPNAKINKNEITAINGGVQELGDLRPSGSGRYIGVTATPARLDLNNTFLNDSKHWVFLDSHSEYKGRQFFFPVSEEERRVSNYQLVKLPDNTDDPKLLRHAVFRFLIRTAMLNIRDTSDLTAYSMLIHTGGKVTDHVKDNQDLAKIIRVLSDKDHKKYLQYISEMQKIATKLVADHKLDETPDNLVVFVLRNIGRHEILVINNKADSGNVKRAGDPQSLFTFAIGGNIVSRGLTFERLLTFFFSRTVKNKLAQNTYIQRARMFGTRGYSQFFELCVPQQLFEDWAEVFQDHELSLRLGRAGIYQHIQSSRSSVVDAGALDKRNVSREKSERTVGGMLNMSAELEAAILSHDPSKPLTFLEGLLAEGLVDESHLPPALLQYLREVAHPSESDVMIVLRVEGGEKRIQNIERYTTDGDPETITRAKGGVVHAMLNRRPEYDRNRHFILPIRNNRGQMRFLYKSNLGHMILQNLRVQRAVTS